MAFMSVLACATFSIGMLQTSAIDAHTDEENPELMVLDEMDWFEEWTDVDAA